MGLPQDRLDDMAQRALYDSISHHRYFQRSQFVTPRLWYPYPFCRLWPVRIFLQFLLELSHFARLVQFQMPGVPAIDPGASPVADNLFHRQIQVLRRPDLVD